MAKKIFPAEIIGKTITVVKSTNEHHVGLQGKVVDETKNTLKIASNGKRLTLFKKTITIEIDGKLLEGETLLRRPEDRIKGR